MKFTQEPYGMLHARNIVAMTPMPFHLRPCAFTTKCTQIYMGCQHVHRLYAHRLFLIGSAVTMILTMVVGYIPNLG
jgi:hypothetical protein